MLSSSNPVLFDKYIVHSKEELALLNKKKNLAGAYMITGDTKHIGIHKLFYIGQLIKRFFERHFLPKKKSLDNNLCHNMICVGWDNSKDAKGFAKNRPVLAHSVLDGVK